MIDVKELGKGAFELRMRCGSGPRKRYVLHCSCKDEARVWAARMVALRDAYVKAGDAIGGAVVLQLLSEQRTEKAFTQNERAAKADLGNARPKTGPVATSALARTVDDFVTLWLSGELHRRWPQHIRALKPRSRAVYVSILQASLAVPVTCAGERVPFGKVPLASITLDQADEVLARMSERGKTMGRQSGSLLRRVLNLAVEPCRLLPQSPLRKGWLPLKSARVAFSYLFPAEERQLLRCPKIDIDLRLFYGFLAREGMRSNEGAELRWGDLDLANGDVRLDQNKTGVPRTWKLGPDVWAALVDWKAHCALSGRDVSASGFVFLVQGDFRNRAARFRRSLRRAGLDRVVLFEKSDQRRPMRLHDLRGTFVTLALASGRTEDWVSARTGHTTSSQISLYRRAASHASEHQLGWFCPLTEVFEGEASATGPRASGPESGPELPTETVSDRNLKEKRLGSEYTSENSRTLSAPVPACESAQLRAAGPVENLSGPPQKGGVGQSSANAEKIEGALVVRLEILLKEWRFEEMPPVLTDLIDRRRARSAPLCTN